ncbi:ammonium transporter [Leptospira sp. GIMC2001]|uniref:ammonium transporter n=1 Tax=Leptospira sp. GIMC2001 TaxID=1513297 RepID=UPI00234BC2FC|nr:ammonium transporter [Leptospira sp. GIMC2001]WCL49282.1 ammonium transporter [Leptospira sp. GIMC2001]
MDEVIPAFRNLSKDVDIMWLIIAAALVFFMQAGFLLLETGLVRSKNSINVAIKNIIDYIVGSVCFFIIGFGLMFGSSFKGYFGDDTFLLEGMAGGKEFAFFLYQVTFMGTAATIVSGAVAERIRFNAYVVCSMFVSILIYPIFGHWAWGGGWLGAIGFYDFAGSTVVHSVGAWVALAGVIVLGPRANRFDEAGKPRELSGHNLPIAVLGAFILWFGWFGFNGGSTLSFNDSIPLIIVNTTISACGGGFAAILFSYIQKGIPSVEGTINGVLGGLVGITACCSIVNPSQALIIGFIAGLIVQVVTYAMENWLHLDDVVGAFPVHGAAGIWGTIAVSLFSIDPSLRGFEQFKIQLIGVVTCGAWSFGLGIILFSVLKFATKLRVSAEDEERGLNESEHGSKTVWLDLMNTMNYIEKSKDLRLKLVIDRGSESGVIAEYFNRLIFSLAQIIGIVKVNSDSIERGSKQLDQATATILRGITEQQEKNNLIQGLFYKLEASLEMVMDKADAQNIVSNRVLNLSGELATQIQIIEKDIHSSNKIVSEIDGLASEGEKILQKTGSSMEGMNQSAKKVEEIVLGLQKIADQLGMLSINAAIESARGGEESAGFTIVAENISKLSEKTGSNAKQASMYLREIWDTIHKSTESIRETSQSFHQILQKLPDLTRYMEKVVESVTEYSSKTDTIHQSIGEVQDTSELVANDIKIRFEELHHMHQLFDDIKLNTESMVNQLQELDSMSGVLSQDSINMHRIVDTFQVNPA